MVYKHLNSGYQSLMDMATICGKDRAISTGKQSVNDYRAAISKGLLKETAEHEDFFLGVSIAVDDLETEEVA